jgi:leucyl-tRNA synthetase
VGCEPARSKGAARARDGHGYPPADRRRTQVSTEPERYDPSAIEPPIARRWAQERTYSLEPGPQQARPEDDAGLYYALTMFPYPSGDLHMGHAEIFTIHDALVRHLRMTGRRVLNPIGWDAFGLPAENAARNRGADPRAWTYANIDEQRSTIVRLGYSFDWDTVLHTCDPDYYRWTQWLFLELFDAGLAYRREAAVNWCGSCGTVLANEQVIDGRGWRSGAVVERRKLAQWVFMLAPGDETIESLGLQSIGWPWYTVIGAGVTMGIGSLLALRHKRALRVTP